MFTRNRIAALAAITAIGLASTMTPAAAWHCHGSYQSYNGYYPSPYYQNYSQGYNPGYYPPRYSYQPQYPNDQEYSYNYPQQDYSQGYSCQGRPCYPGYPRDQYGDGQDYNNGQNYDDYGPNGGS